MTDVAEHTPDAAPAASPESFRRKFLVVADGSKECRVALRYAALRAALTRGCVSLLYVIEPADFQHWRAVEDRMREEARQDAESVLHDLAGEVNELVDLMPELLIREGSKAEQVLAAIKEDPSIHVLVIAAGVGKEGPGPLVNMVAGKTGAGFSIPVTVVPGDMTEDDIDEISQ
jgi:nucleotide-binding universal stress UspA family protein